MTAGLPRVQVATAPLAEAGPSCPASASHARGPAPALLVDGAIHPLPDGGSLVAGSGPEAAPRLPDPHVSGRHARFVRRGRRVLVQDLDSTNGTLHRGRRIDGVEVGPGEAILLGRRPVLVVEVGGLSRHPDAVRWREFMARDRGMLSVLGEIATNADLDAPVWLHGESGAGKELAAHALHACSPRAEGPLVTLNCAAIPAELAEAELFGARKGAFTGADRDRRGAFQRAHGGTLLLDEVGELPPDLQAKLLRALESGEVQPVGADRPVPADVRVVSATWRPPTQLADEGRLRFDLLQRLRVLRVDLPPLRRRPADVGPLLERFFAELDAPGLWPDAALRRHLERASWPGNVRELRNRVHRAVASGDPDLLAPDEAPPRSSGLPRRGRVPDERVLARIRRSLARHGGNRAAAARELGIGRSTLYRWLERLRDERADA